MRIGSTVYATQQGLGIVAKDFFDHGVVTHPYVVLHDRHENHHSEWYPSVPTIPIRMLSVEPGRTLLRDWVRSLDVFLAFETPFDWSLFEEAKSAGVKTVLMPMHECTPTSIVEYRRLIDLFLCPSHLDYRVFDQLQGGFGKAVHVPVPVPSCVEYRRRERAEVFVHSAGWGGLRGRNGTQELMESLQHVKSKCKVKVFSQKPIDWSRGAPPNVDLEMKTGVSIPLADLWRGGGYGDVFVFPEKFNGLSLPLQEARASGMAVLATDRFPMDQWLPREHLIQTKSSKKSRIGGGYLEFDEAVVDPADIAAKIDEVCGSDLTEVSESALEWRRWMSWENLGPEYARILASV